MRKIERQLREAISSFKPFSKSNTTFAPMSGTKEGWRLSLHGNPIATFDQGGKNPTVPTWISLAGWNSKTTRSRLNALDGVHVVQRNFIPFLNGKEIDSTGWWNPSDPTY